MTEMGAETYKRRWVKYEIEKSHSDGKGIIGIRIHNVKDFRTGATDIAGLNPLDQIRTLNGTPFSRLYPTYDWVTDNGRINIDQWIETASQKKVATTNSNFKEMVKKIIRLILFGR